MIRKFRLKRRVKKLLFELDLRDSFDAPLLVKKLCKKGYSILLDPVSMPLGLNSTCIFCENTYVIFYQKYASHFHQQYLIFHELAHILLGHRKLHKEELLWGGTLYSRWEERESEMFASLLMEAKLRISGVEYFQQVFFPHQKSPPLEGQGWVEETESLQKIAHFFQRFDA